MDEIVRKCIEEDPAVIVVDGAKALRDFSGGGRSMRSAVHQLAARFAHTETTLLFVGEYSSDEIEPGPEFSLADGIVELVYESHQPMDRRWLRVRKLRGSNHLSGQHALRISEAGISVYPRAETLDGHLQAAAEPDGRISTGVAGLDEMSHGGLPRGGSTLVLGPSGCGKTALGLRFVMQGLEDGERCLYVTFQENPNQLIAKAASFGWDLRPHLESEQLTIYHVPEGSLDLDIMASVVRTELSKAPLHRMVIDSLAEMVVAARVGTLSRLCPHPPGFIAGRGGLSAYNQRDQQPRPDGGDGWRHLLYVPQRGVATVHRAGVGGGPCSRHHKDAKQ